MNKLIKLLLLTLPVVSFASGIYGNVGAGVNTTTSTAAYNVNAGYMFNDYIGVEGGYTKYGANYWDVAAKAVLPIPVVDIYGKLGMAVENNDYSNSGALMYGAGVSLPILPHLRVSVEDYVLTNYATQNFVMAGLQLSF